MYEEYDALIKERLTPKRYHHSLCVAAAAKKLAEMFGEEPSRAYLAGLLHDICKNDSDENILKLFEKFGILLDNTSAVEQKLWHAIAGAAYARHILRIEDEGVISAIRYHTTARAGMSLLEKIVFLADFISDDRDFEGVEQLRKSAKRGLDYAIYSALRFTVLDLAERSRPIHPDSVFAYNEAVISVINGKVK